MRTPSPKMRMTMTYPSNNTPLEIERINERDREEPELTVSCLYDAQGEPISDKAWAKRLDANNTQEPEVY